MSTLLLKHLQEPGLDELKNRSHIITRERRVSRRVIPALSLGVFGIFAIRGFTCPVTGRTNQDLASQNVPTGLLTRNNGITSA
jgi:hypothetical protein